MRFVPKAMTIDSEIDGNLLDLDEDEWEKVVEESKNQTVIIDLWAPWCDSCGGSKQTYVDFARDNSDKPITFIKFNLGKNKELGKMLQLKALPAIFVVKNGEALEHKAKPSRDKRLMNKNLNELVKIAVKL
jgi:thioredoxin-like negative regulator of GroEL